MAAGPVEVTVSTQPGGTEHKGRVTFIDNAVDTPSGTIRVKAEFANRDTRLWPGMYANAELSPRVITGTVVPAQAVQTGPENRFVYVVGNERKVESRPVTLAYVDEGFAVVEGVAPGVRVVVEGAQNLRPGTVVTEATEQEGRQSTPPADAGKGPGSKPSAATK